jgi:hypothetical protein
MSKKIRLFSVLAALVALSMLFVSPALAHHKDGHDGGPPHGSDSSQSQQSSGGGSDHDGDADSDPNTEYTEDNDTNDGGTPNNQPDEGDNRHPSGKDRSVENGGSGNQGKSESDPDGNSNGGRDKPNGSGGLDLADQDGNNGCGNDDDFEDDNNGNCGGRQGKPKTPGNPGNSASQMTINASCYTVTVTSTKDISNVTVTFADGTTIKREGLSGTTFTETFTKPIASASAKAGTTVVSDTVSESCVGGNVVTKPLCPAGTDMAGLPIPPGGIAKCNLAKPPRVCPNGTDMAGQPVPPGGIAACNQDEPLVCPDGTDMAGMPIPPGGVAACVLGTRITNPPPVAPAPDEPAPAALLPFTGSSLSGFLIAALVLLTAGLVLLRVRATQASM